MIQVDCLRSEHRVENESFPIFIGFMKPSQLNNCAEAPQFQLQTADEVIAGNVISNPVREWQRPRDANRVAEITRIFNSSSEIMPNAVLLAAPDPTAIVLQHAGSRDLWTLRVPDQTPKPLWILDGQHRIAGLAASSCNDAIPFVLLAAHDSSAQYQQSTFAKIFAQVTTTAEGLHPLHDEWLKFAFHLDKYDTSSPEHSAQHELHVKSMKTVVDLCHDRFLDVGETKANPFFDRIAFNPRVTTRMGKRDPIGPLPGGFEWDAVAWESIIYSSYYGHRDAPAQVLSPTRLASEIGLAYDALVACHRPAEIPSSVLLQPVGTHGGQGHKALQDGLVHGLLRFLAMHGPPESWTRALESRGFASTDWTTSAWATTSARTGEVQTLNKRLAKSIFEALLGGDLTKLFLEGQSAPATLDLVDYFNGGVGAGIVIQSRRRGTRGNLARFNGNSDRRVEWRSGEATLRFDLGTHPAMQFSPVTPNVIQVAVVDTARPHEKEWDFQKLRRGLHVTDAMKTSSPIKLEVQATFYGGRARKFDLNIRYS